MAETGNISCLELFYDVIPVLSDTQSGYVSDKITLIFQWIFCTVMCLGIALFGIVTNIINITCFVMQGFKDPVNISFLGLAISDIGCLDTLLWTNLCYTPAFVEADVPFDSMELQYLTSAMPHTAFTRVTSWITALITLERCLCITAPLKVKSIITHRRVIIIIVLVFIILIFSTTPAFVVNRLGMKFFPARNTTLLGLLYTEDRESVESVSYVINNVLIPFGAFVIVIVCTIILVVQLQHKTNWRKQSTTSAQADIVSLRNQKVARMVVIISFLFIICFVPISIIFIAMSLEPELSIAGKYKNYFTIFGGMGMMLESVNSSGNIFIYYHMSSKFKLVFHRLIFRDIGSSTKFADF